MTDTLDIKITKTQHSRLAETDFNTCLSVRFFLTTCLWPIMPMANGKILRYCLTAQF
jgi:hypothetical protein